MVSEQDVLSKSTYKSLIIKSTDTFKFYVPLEQTKLPIMIGLGQDVQLKIMVKNIILINGELPA
jgi:hypothetical protein